MSEDEYWNGTAKVVKPKGKEDLESLCRRIFEGHSLKKSEYTDTYAEALLEEAYKQFVIVDGVLYDTSRMVCRDDCPDICEASRIDEDTVKVTLKFYNGGTCFGEMFEAAIKKLPLRATK